MMSEHMAVHTTKRAIQAEFMREYRKTPCEKITVKALCACTPVARTTFYSYYQNIDELEEEIEDELIVGLQAVAKELSGGNLPDMAFSPFFSHTMAYIKEHWDYIYLFLIVQPNLRFIAKWKNAVKEHFKARYPEKLQIPNYDLIAEVLASATLGAYSYWLQNPDKVSENELVHIVTAALDAVSEII